MLHKNRWLIATIIVELILIFIIGFIIGLNFANSNYIYYLVGIIGNIPFIYFLYKLKEFDLIKGDVPKTIPINWQLLIALIIPILPMLFFSIIVVNLRMDYFIAQTLLSFFVAITGGVIDAIVLFGNFFRKHLISTIFAIIGLASAYAITQGNISSNYAVVIGIPLVFAAIFATLAAIAPLFTMDKRKRLVKLVGIDTISFIFILASYFVSNTITNTDFSVSFGSLPQLFYTVLLTLGWGLLFSSIIAFLLMLANLGEVGSASNYMENKAIEIKSEHLLHTNKDLTNVKSNFRYYLSFLPIWPTEQLITPDGLEELLKSEIRWWDVEPLESNILSGASKDVEMDSRTKKLVNSLIKELSKLAEDVIKNYIAFYKEIMKQGKNNKTLVLAVFNTLLGYSKYYWPNIYNTIYKDEDLKRQYDALMKSVEKNEDIKNFMKVLGTAKDFRVRIDGLDSE